MTLSTEFWIQMIITVGTLGVTFGGVLTRIKSLEKKMDKHNNIVERLAKVEECTKSAHHRIDELND